MAFFDHAAYGILQTEQIREHHLFAHPLENSGFTNEDTGTLRSKTEDRRLESCASSLFSSVFCLQVFRLFHARKPPQPHRRRRRRRGPHRGHPADRHHVLPACGLHAGEPEHDSSPARAHQSAQGLHRHPGQQDAALPNRHRRQWRDHLGRENRHALGNHRASQGRGPHPWNPASSFPPTRTRATSRSSACSTPCARPAWKK